MLNAQPRCAGLALALAHCALCIACATTAPPVVAVQAPPAVAGAAPTDEPAQTVAGLPQLRTDLLALTQSPGVRRGTWGIVVQSLDRNERLFDLNPHALLVPGSIVKLLSLATALDAVGPDYRFTTTIGITGEIVDGVLQGDLVIDGSGDPSLGGRGGDDMRVLIEAITSAGIARVDGRIIGSDNRLEDARPALAWAWDDLGYPSGALFGALNYGENRTVVTVMAGSSPGLPGNLMVEPFADGRPIVNRTLTGAPGTSPFVWPEQRPGEPALTIAGTVAAGAPAARVNISAGNPTLWFASVLRNRLIAAGVPVSGPAVDGDDVATWTPARVIYTYRSPTLAELAQPMLKDSINLYAESALRLNAAVAPLPQTNDAALDGFKRRMAAWGISADAHQIIDGSGLSRRDAAAPEAFLTVLQRMHDRSGTSPWMRALPIAGVDGTLEARMKGTPAANNVRAKTGTMSNIRSLAGYVTTADGERLAFVIMLNDFEGAGATALQAIDSLVVRLATFRR